jgi:serine/threonine protein kinase
MLTGKLPFEARTPMEYIQHHITKPPIHLDVRVPGKTFPPGLGNVLEKALEKRPEDRYTTAADFAEALKPFAPGGGKGFSGLFPKDTAALAVSSRGHDEAKAVQSRPQEHRQPDPPVSAATPSARSNGSPGQTPSHRSHGAEPSSTSSLRSPGAAPPQRGPMPSSGLLVPGTEGAPSVRTPPSSKPSSSQPTELEQQSSPPSVLVLVAVAVGFLLVGVLLAVVVLKLVR